MVGLGRLELPHYGLGNRRSIHLSYSAETIRYSDYHRGYAGCEACEGCEKNRSNAVSRLLGLRSFIPVTCATIGWSPHPCPQVPSFGGRYESHPSQRLDWNWCPDRIADRCAVFHSGKPVQAHDRGESVGTAGPQSAA